MKYSAAFLFASAASVAAARSRLDNHARPSVFNPLNGEPSGDCNRFATVDVVRELGASPSNDFPTISIAPLSTAQRLAAAESLLGEDQAARHARNAAELGYTLADLESGEERARQAQAKRDRKAAKRKPT